MNLAHKWFVYAKGSDVVVMPAFSGNRRSGVRPGEVRAGRRSRGEAIVRQTAFVGLGLVFAGGLGLLFGSDSVKSFMVFILLIPGLLILLMFRIVVGLVLASEGYSYRGKVMAASPVLARKAALSLVTAEPEEIP